MPAWLLPENIADILPSEARKIEELRRLMLDRFRTYGYELVAPPMLEYVESLLTGTGHDLDLRTFKLVDQLSGRMMGLRADITPQVARIDAHLLNRQGVTRLCYAGSVLHARAQGFHTTREPLQIGCEIYGHAGLEADLEIQQIALDCLQLVGIKQLRLDLCHAGILQAILAAETGLNAQTEQAFLSALQDKDSESLAVAAQHLSKNTQQALLALPSLYGSVAMLAKARAVLPQLVGITKALDELATLATSSPADVTIDLADLRGYRYHSGAMFSIYVPGWSNAVVRGGRYDQVGTAFGRSRPATGFSLDLRELSGLSSTSAVRPAIRAPWLQNVSLKAAIARLRDAGEIVIQILPGHEQDLEEFDCDRVLVETNGQWQVQARQA
ncbi:ATP phosphoribosyltransferase regulatory subunit [Ampullimonas aquatilis]|uniref:ATP phosphoribosyltransferase regulatory subunit n=1 Tax=Ampullimonas aquatilis TaxID=1341549 RepID=UPI003C71294D